MPDFGTTAQGDGSVRIAARSTRLDAPSEQPLFSATFDPAIGQTRDRDGQGRHTVQNPVPRHDTPEQAIGSTA